MRPQYKTPRPGYPQPSGDLCVTVQSYDLPCPPTPPAVCLKPLGGGHWERPQLPPLPPPLPPPPHHRRAVPLIKRPRPPVIPNSCRSRSSVYQAVSHQPPPPLLPPPLLPLPVPPPPPPPQQQLQFTTFGYQPLLLSTGSSNKRFQVNGCLCLPNPHQVMLHYLQYED